MSDGHGFEAFLERYQDMVYATAVRLLGHLREAEAEDVSQTVFLRAFERFAEIGESPAAAGWLRTVTTNLCLNYLSRYRNRWRFFSELRRLNDRGESEPFEAGLASDTSIQAGAEQADEYARLEEAVRRLPAHQRVPLVLFHFEHKSYQEIATLIGVSLSKVKTDIHRGREVLRQQLARDDGSR